MAAAGRTVVTYHDFSGGEYGSLGSWNAPKGSFTGSNVVRYVDGSLGPRNGIKALTVTGLPASSSGTHVGLDPNGRLYFQTGTLVKTIEAVDVASQAANSIGDAGVDLGQGVLVDGFVYAGTSGAGLKKLDFTTPAVTAVGSSPNGALVVQYGERTLIAGSSEPQRIYYSAAGNPESWPASNFLDVGAGNTIKAMISLRSGVAIYTVGNQFTGIDGRWWILTGVPGVNDTLREVLTGTQGPTTDADVAMPGDGIVLFAAAKSEAIGFFDGSRVSLIRHLSLGTPTSIDVRSVVSLREESDALVLAYATATPYSAVGYMRRDGAWFKQAFSEVDVKHVITTRDGVLPSGGADIARAQNIVIFNNGSSPPTFYIWSAYNDRPPFETDASATILDAEDVYFTLPEWWARDGEEVSVRKVSVSFRDWDTDDADANQFDVKVTSLRQYEGGEGATQTQSFSRATSASSSSGVNLRRDFGFTDSHGNGFRLQIANMRGVAIQKIQVVLNTRPMQGVG